MENAVATDDNHKKILLSNSTWNPVKTIIFITVPYSDSLSLETKYLKKNLNFQNI